MIHSIEPSSFYGKNRATLDLVRKIRLSRLGSTVIDPKISKDNETDKRSRSSGDKGSRVSKPKIKKVKLFAGIKHGVKKPNYKIQQVKKWKINLAKRSSVRQVVKEKFDLSRTFYALPQKKPRVALSEESGLKRKFFKSTIPTEQPKKTEPSPPVDLEDFNDAEEEPVVKISNLIQHIDWSDDEEYMKPQLTRKKAVALSNEAHHTSISYITPMEPVTSTTTFREVTNYKENVKNTPKTYVELKTSAMPVITPSPRKLENDKNTPRTPETVTPKYYPIFTSPPASNMLSDVTNKQPKCKVSLIKAASPNDQYQIDAGQKVIGPTECKKCGMVYDIGDPIDEQRHLKYHISTEELKYKVSKFDNIVGIIGTDIIILIQYSDSKSKVDKVHDILKQTENEIGTGYSFGPHWKAFVYTRQGCVLGCAITEPISNAHRMLRSDGIALLSEQSYRVKCGINRIWVKREYRGQKVATALMNCLRINYIYGDYLALDDIAFSITTDEGNGFAKKYTGRHDYLSYSG